MLVMMMVGDAGGDWYGEVHGTLFCPSDGKRDTHRPTVCSGTTKPRLLPFFRGESTEQVRPLVLFPDSAFLYLGHFGRGRDLCFSPHGEGSLQ